MAKTSENADEPRQERLEGLLHVESKITEAAEAAAAAAAHAVEATKAAEAASRARLSRKSKAAKTSKAASAAKAAKGKAAKEARSAEALSEATVHHAAPQRSRKARKEPSHVLELRLTGDELAQIERVAASKGLAVPALARSLLMESLADDESQ